VLQGHRRFWAVLLLTVVPAALFGPAWGQSAASDRAKALLNKGVAEYKALNFKAAKATLRAVRKEALSETDRKELAEYRTKADLALQKQAQAAEAYIEAEEALRNNDLAKAKASFEKAASNPYLHTQTRRDARARLAEVMAKMKAFQTGEPSGQPKPEPAPVTQAPQPTTQPVRVTAPETEMTPQEELEAILNDHGQTMSRAAAKEPEGAVQAQVAGPSESQWQAEMSELEPVPSERTRAKSPSGRPEVVAEQSPPQPTVETARADGVLERLAAKQDAQQARAEPSETESPEAVAETSQGEDIIRRLAEKQEAQPTEVEPAQSESPEARPESVQPPQPMGLEEVPETGAGQAEPVVEEPQPLPGRGRPERPTPAAGSDILRRLQEKMRVAKQVVDVEYEKSMSASQEAMAGELSKEAFDQAENMARAAKNTLEENKRLYGAREYRQKLSQVEDQLQYISTRREQWQRQLVDEQARQIEQDRLRRIQRQTEQRQRHIQSLRSRAETLIDEQHYKEALELIEEILKLDPENSWAGARMDLLEQLVLVNEEKELDRTQAIEEQKVLTDVRRSEIPWYEYLRYPSDWRELSRRRSRYAAGEITESEADVMVRREMAKTMTELEADEMPLEDVIGFLRDYSGLSIHVKWNVLEVEGITRDTPVTVVLRNVTFEKALRTILDDVGGVSPLGYIVDDGVITVSTRTDLSGMAYSTTRVYDIRDLIFQVPQFAAGQLGLRGPTGGGGGGGLGGGGGTISPGTFGAPTQAQAGPSGPVSRQQVVQDIITLIQDTIEPDSWRPAGTIGSVREIHGHLVVTQTAENHRKIMSLIQQLREAKRILISVETRFITVNTGYLESIGVDLDFFLNLGSSLNPGVVIDPATGTSVNQQLPGGPWAGKPGNDKWTPIGVFQDNSFASMVGNTSAPLGTQSIATMLSNSAFSLAGTFLDDIQVNFLIEATQAHHATRTLIAPKVTLFNGQRSNIQIIRELQYITDFERDVQTTQVGIVEEVDVDTDILQTGIQLDLEATVSADRRYVILTLRPQITELEGFRDVPEVEYLEFPELFSQAMATTVSIPDGGTLLIGGLKRSGELERELGVPVLSKIPVINRAFTNRGKVRDEETLLILIRPKIIIQQEEEEMRFPPGA